MEFSYYEYLLLPLLIFFARIADQSVGTLRLIFVAKGYKNIAPILGFFEVIIWLLAVGQIIQDLTNVVAIVAYGAGFAAGNYIGIKLDEKLMLGNVFARIIVANENYEMTEALKSSGFGLTKVDAEGNMGPVKIIYSIMKRRDLNTFINIIHRFDPHIFFTVEDVKSVSEGVFRKSDGSLLNQISSNFRKSK